MGVMMISRYEDHYYPEANSPFTPRAPKGKGFSPVANFHIAMNISTLFQSHSILV